MSMFAKRKALRAAVAAARLPEIVEGELKQALLTLGEYEYQRRGLDSEIDALAGKATALRRELALGVSRLADEKAKAEELAAKEQAQ